MKRLQTVAIVLVAVPGFLVIVYCGLGLFYWVCVFADRWPSQETMVQSGYSLIPEARQIDSLFGPARHQTSNYKEPDIVEWQTEVQFAGRYDLTMLVHVQIDRRSGMVLGVLEKPRFILAEINKVNVDPNGVVSISYGESHEFGLAEWQKIVAAKGDFSMIGIHLDRNSPIPNVGKARPGNGIQMATGLDKPSRR